MDPREGIAGGALTSFQIGVIFVLFALNALDGFDVLAISFAAPGISHDWALSPAAIGVIISVGLVGNGFGSLGVAPFADTIGRRPIMLASLAAMTCGMLMCAAASRIGMLWAGRLVTGVGVGALVPCISALAAEYSNRRYRTLAVMVMAVGFPVGGLVGGAVSAWLLRHFSWHAVFVFGAAATGGLTLAPLFVVPESLDYLIARHTSRSLSSVNHILRRLKQPPLLVLPANGSAGARRGGVDLFMQPALLLLALTITLIYALHNATLYYALNWIPKIVVELGLSQSQAASVAAWCSGGGVIGVFAAAAITPRVEATLLSVVLLVLTSALLCVFARVPAQLGLLIGASSSLGAFLYAAQASLYALMTKSFPVHVRATGVGFVTGVGRLGGVLSPLVAGHLLSVGLRYAQVSAVMAVGSSLGAAILLGRYLYKH